MNLEFRTLYPEEIECRVAQITDDGASLLLYKDARVDQRLLDEVVGPLNWQRHHSRDNANCTVAIWDSEKGQWIEKEDTGKESNTEAEKGLASDSFKRACFNWGIGRELYTAPRVWVSDVDVKEKNGRKYTYDRFEVSQITYDTMKNIQSLVIRNAKTKKVVFTYGKEVAKETKPEKPKTKTQEEKKPDQMSEEEMQAVAKQKITPVKVSSLTTELNKRGIPVDKILKLYKVKSLADLTELKLSHINQNWENIQKA